MVSLFHLLRRSGVSEKAYSDTPRREKKEQVDVGCENRIKNFRPIGWDSLSCNNSKAAIVLAVINLVFLPFILVFFFNLINFFHSLVLCFWIPLLLYLCNKVWEFDEGEKSGRGMRGTSMAYQPKLCEFLLFFQFPNDHKR